MIESIGELTDSAARAVVWNTAIDMVRQAELPVSSFIAMLAAGIQQEPSVSVRQALLAHADQILTHLADPRHAAEGKRQLADVAGQMLDLAQPAGDDQLAWAQLLSWTATSTDQLDLIGGLLDGSSPAPGLSINAELRWSLLQRLAATGRADDASIDAELARDPSDAGRRNAAACRAAIPDAQHKEAAWELLISGRLGPESLTTVARGFTQPEQAHLLIPYAARYLTELAKIWATRSGHLRIQLSELLFPYPAAASELLMHIDEFLSATPRDHALTRVLTERRDTVQRALRSRALPR